MDDKNYYLNDDELIASMTNEEFLEYIECLAIEIEEEGKENE